MTAGVTMTVQVVVFSGLSEDASTIVAMPLPVAHTLALRSLPLTDTTPDGGLMD
jgi:hypothetical protein